MLDSWIDFVAENPAHSKLDRPNKTKLLSIQLCNVMLYCFVGKDTEAELC